MRLDNDTRLETEIQAAFMRLCKKHCPLVKVTSVPNGGKRGQFAARQAKREGMATGMYDTICWWSWQEVGLIEFKRPSHVKNGKRVAATKPDANQSELHEQFRGMGFREAVCWNEYDALDLLRSWGAPFFDQAKTTPRMDWEVSAPVDLGAMTS